jgi:hypothetical protein
MKKMWSARSVKNDEDAMMPFPGGIFGHLTVGAVLVIIVIVLWLAGLLLAAIGGTMIVLGGWILLGFSPIGGPSWPSLALAGILAIIGIAFLWVF